MSKPITAKSYLSMAVAKPVCAGIAAAAADHLILKNPNLRNSAMFGAATAAGIGAVSVVGPFLGKLAPTHTPIGALGKNLEARVAETLLGSAAVYMLNAKVLGNQYSSEDWMQRIAIIGASDIVGETIAELIIHM